ncbi:alpha/beta fold hydrolase [Streptomyces collinus]|uniref:alpha/beta fold hydrolase n=1 Tax=Streptomyces collinus TaxID=42684 RepID=UPI00363DB034
MSIVQDHGGKPATSALRLRHCPQQPQAALITLHGGQADSYQTSQPWHLAALRMRPVLRAAASALPLDDIVLAHVRYRHRGWNQNDPLNDTYRALNELHQLAGPVPTILIGHSMGGRAALRAAVHPHVHGVLALAPSRTFWAELVWEAGAVACGFPMRHLGKPHARARARRESLDGRGRSRSLDIDTRLSRLLSQRAHDLCRRPDVVRVNR